ncbi:hypothetical protein Hanom_Chr08g00736661 [Helianthus anomalus]
MTSTDQAWSMHSSYGHAKILDLYFVSINKTKFFKHFVHRKKYIIQYKMYMSIQNLISIISK